jgi:ABC-2 type transport system permease protein
MGGRLRIDRDHRLFLRRAAAVCRHDFRVLSHDPGPLVSYTIIPLFATAFLLPLYHSVVSRTTIPGTAAQQAVPGIAVMFSSFLVTSTGFAFFREHAWGTWDRLRASGGPMTAIVLGKLVPPVTVVVVQQAILFTAGTLLFGLRVRGSVAALAALVVLFALCLVLLGVLLFASCRTMQQLATAASTLAMVNSGFGGAIAPVALLPDWMQTIAPITPSYWVLVGMRGVVRGAGFAGTWPSLVALIGFTVVVATGAALRFDVATSKRTWA